MTESKKGFIAPLVFILIAFLFIGGGSYAYKYYATTLAEDTAFKVPETPKFDINNDQTLEEKVLMQRYSDYMLSGLSEEDRKLASPLNEICDLKYYDSSKVLIGCSKVGAELYLLDRNTWAPLGDSKIRIHTAIGYVQSEHYLMSVRDSTISYYKAGDTTMREIPNVQLAEGETVIKSVGMLDEYTLSFDEQSKTLTETLYRRTGQYYPSGEEKGDRIPTRTVKVVLP